jgi:hypothetical protein
MRDPKSMEMIPPTVKRPWDITLTSARNRIIAKMMRRSPA